ncbi:MAG: hypothetical protein KF781_03275 [Chitinophagaceae bacterium]|nr:hypothetical protein [Chitinophagaceae bacterium]MCW5904534.1 hypothetical protein [Chitinophagaceae bacterium]
MSRGLKIKIVVAPILILFGCAINYYLFNDSLLDSFLTSLFITLLITFMVRFKDEHYEKGKIKTEKQSKLNA